MAAEGENIWNAGGGDIVVLGLMEETSWGGAPNSSDAARWAAPTA